MDSTRAFPICKWLPILVFLGGPVAGAPAGTWFTDVTEESGLDFVHEAGATGTLEMPESMAAGAALFDFDQDGDLDIYLTNGSFEFSDPDGSHPQPVNRLYRQDDGRFVEVTESSGLGDPGYGMGMAIADYDGDGFPDLYCTNVGPDRLYRNRGDGTFEDVTEAAGIDVPRWSCSASFLDFDADGDADLYVTRYVDFNSEKRCTDAAGRPEYCGPLEFPPVPDVLLRNEGDGTFVDVSESAGMAAVAAAGLGVVCEDFNHDGMTDIYVANDAYANHCWINQGDGTFYDDALLMGAAFNLQGMAEAGMGILAADFDNDLDLDIFLTHLRNESNTLYSFEGVDIGFEDRTAEWGLSVTSMPTTGFGTAALDVELDGTIDIFVGNGSITRGDPFPGVTVPAPWNLYAEPNHLYLNRGNGRFEVAGAEAGLLGSRVEMTRGVAAGDVDSDGDIDLLLSHVHGPARLYRNDAPRRGRWLSLRVLGGKGIAHGAAVTVEADGRHFLRTVAPGCSYLSSNDPRVHFGLGEVVRVDGITVRWPDGVRERFPGAEPDQELELRRGQGTVLP